MITNQNGAIVSRHDYRAFGEEVYSGIGNRSNAQGYGQADGVRQKYTGYERDYESGLDFAQARYYNSKLGRFTSVDPLTASANVKDPQTFNRYSYVFNNPYKYTDNLGLMAETGCSAENANCSSSDGMSEFERQYEEGIQTSIDQRRAQAAANRGDMDGFWEILDGNDDLQAQDAQGNAMSNPNTPSGADHNGLAPTSAGETVEPPIPAQSTIEVIIWEAAANEGISSWMGHVSYVINGTTSYSWQADKDENGNYKWTVDPVGEYLAKRRKISTGRGFVLNFGFDKKGNDLTKQFSNKLVNSMKGKGYGTIWNNCGQPFNNAIDGMRGILNIPQNNSTLPESHGNYILKNLKRFTLKETKYSKRK